MIGYNGRSAPQGDMDDPQPADRAPPKKKSSFKVKRQDPEKEKFKRKLYKIGMEPHEAADGIMR